MSALPVAIGIIAMTLSLVFTVTIWVILRWWLHGERAALEELQATLEKWAAALREREATLQRREASLRWAEERFLA